MTDVLINRELLERATQGIEAVAAHFGSYQNEVVKELRAVLAAPRQPEGEGLEVVATLEIGDYEDDESIYAQTRKEFTIAEVCEDDKLVRFSDAQRALAELREECSFLKDCQENAMLHMTGLVAERDTLRQQLAERDATIERLEAGIPRLQEQAYQMRQQRDKLAGLLRDALKLGELDRVLALRARVMAALAEVNK